jgi:hypothetical protein
MLFILTKIPQILHSHPNVSSIIRTDNLIIGKLQELDFGANPVCIEVPDKK